MESEMAPVWVDNSMTYTITGDKMAEAIETTIINPMNRCDDSAKSGKIGDFMKNTFFHGVESATTKVNTKSVGLVSLFLTFNIMILLVPLYALPVFAVYVLAEGIRLSHFNSKWRLIMQYIFIGWLRHYVYMVGYMFGMLRGGNNDS